jgi:hypothetical protein
MSAAQQEAGNPATLGFSELCRLLMFPLLSLLPAAAAAVVGASCRGQYLYQPSYGMYSNIVLPMLIGFVICSMILATGPTGFAGNPARDLVRTLGVWTLLRCVVGVSAAVLCLCTCHDLSPLCCGVDERA